MDEGLKRTAQLGDIDALYALIRDDADVLRRIDQMEFVDTPLHIAAAKGHTDFAMEMMNLKPSFARKLNQDGFSPVHLALQHGHTEMVADLISVDKDLVRVKGREGYTALHYAASREGNATLLSKFLDYCPDCIFDLTNRKETALHIAARNNIIDAFEAILQRTRMTDAEFYAFLKTGRTILNLQDKDGNTILHIAASNNQSQMIKRLIKCKEMDMSRKNKRGLTASDLQRETQVNSRSGSVKIPKTGTMYQVWRIVAKLNNNFQGMTPETINALLVVFALVLTMTYQAILSPPAGLSQGDAAGSNKDRVGKSVLTPSGFLLFYIPNGTAFVMAWFMTLNLFLVVARSMMPFLLPFYTLMGVCYWHALSIIAPSTYAVYVVLFSVLIIPGLILGISFSIARKQ